MRKVKRKKIDAFEMWCCRRVMRVSWMERKTKMTSFMSYLNVLVYLNINLVFFAFSNYFINILIQS